MRVILTPPQLAHLVPAILRTNQTSSPYQSLSLPNLQTRNADPTATSHIGAPLPIGKILPIVLTPFPTIRLAASGRCGLTGGVLRGPRPHLPQQAHASPQNRMAWHWLQQRTPGDLAGPRARDLHAAHDVTIGRGRIYRRCGMRACLLERHGFELLK
jgi:hypothetical protein